MIQWNLSWWLFKKIITMRKHSGRNAFMLLLHNNALIWCRFFLSYLGFVHHLSPSQATPPTTNPPPSSSWTVITSTPSLHSLKASHHTDLHPLVFAACIVHIITVPIVMATTVLTNLKDMDVQMYFSTFFISTEVYFGQGNNKTNNYYCVSLGHSLGLWAFSLFL